MSIRVGIRTKHSRKFVSRARRLAVRDVRRVSKGCKAIRERFSYEVGKVEVEVAKGFYFVKNIVATLEGPRSLRVEYSASDPVTRRAAGRRRGSQVVKYGPRESLRKFPTQFEKSEGFVGEVESGH